jgi:hypothetical protein
MCHDVFLMTIFVILDEHIIPMPKRHPPTSYLMAPRFSLILPTTNSQTDVLCLTTTLNQKTLTEMKRFFLAKNVQFSPQTTRRQSKFCFDLRPLIFSTNDRRSPHPMTSYFRRQASRGWALITIPRTTLFPSWISDR